MAVTMVAKVGQLKPFMLEEKKVRPRETISERTANKLQGCKLSNLKKNEKWVPFLSKMWKLKRWKIGASRVTRPSNL